MAAGEGPEASHQASILDQPSTYPNVDPSGLRSRLRTFPDQCRKACQEAIDFRLPPEYANVGTVVIAGMGGSAIGGDLLADLASLETSPPISVARDYRLPPYVDAGTLVLACSYSGETEETISCFRQALSRGAKVAAVTSGGTLASEATEAGVPLFRIGYRGEPRSALGYSFIVPMVVLTNLGLISDKTEGIGEALPLLEGVVAELNEESQSEGNRAKQMAVELLGRLIVIYGSGSFTSVARRWKTQFNENSKTWAFFEQLPEANHNAVVGYSLPAEIRHLATAILLRPGNLHPRTDLGYEAAGELLKRESIPYLTVEGRGESALSQILSTVLLGDYVSYYLAVLQGVDPGPVPSIDSVKERMSPEPGA